METSGVLLLCGIGAALIGGSVFAAAGVNAFWKARQGRRAAERSGTGMGWQAFALMRGFLPFVPLAQRLLRVRVVERFVGRLCDAFRYSGIQAEPRAVASSGLLALGIIGALSWAASGSAVCAVALMVCAVIGAASWAAKQKEAWRERLREEIPEALQSMKACFQVGYSLPQTMREARGAVDGPLCEVFKEVEGVLETGGGIEQALAVLKEKGKEPELVFLSAALEIQHKTGGSMQHILEVARQSIVDEISLKRALRTQTAQARLSAQIVTIMPFVLIGVFSLVSPGFLSPFFESAVGLVMLVVALAMQALGIFLVRKLLKVQVA